MKKIMLCCAAGMSTSMLVQKMRAEAEKRSLAVEINAYPVAEIEQQLAQADVVLLGPQVQFELARLSEISAPLGKPVAVIDMMDYGTMRGDRLDDDIVEAIVESRLPRQVGPARRRLFREGKRLVDHHLPTIEPAALHLGVVRPVMLKRFTENGTTQIGQVCADSRL